MPLAVKTILSNSSFYESNFHPIQTKSPGCGCSLFLPFRPHSSPLPKPNRHRNACGMASGADGSAQNHFAASPPTASAIDCGLKTTSRIGNSRPGPRKSHGISSAASRTLASHLNSAVMITAIPAWEATRGYGATCHASRNWHIFSGTHRDLCWSSSAGGRCISRSDRFGTIWDILQQDYRFGDAWGLMGHLDYECCYNVLWYWDGLFSGSLN